MTHPAALQAGTAAFKARWHNFKLIKSQEEAELHFRIPYEELQGVIARLGTPNLHDKVEVGFARLNPDHAGDSTKMIKPSKPKGEHGDYAAKLYKSGFFLNEAVCVVLGSDAEFLSWIREQPSCVDGDEFNIQACHVRRVSAGSGTAIKPPYSAVPMTQPQHHTQTVNGELACLQKYMPAARYDGAQEAKEWFWKKRCHYVQEWGKQQFKALFEANSLADISPEDIHIWAGEHDLLRYLPQS